MTKQNDPYLTQTDLLSWRMERDPVLRSTIVAVALLDRAPDWGGFVRMMERGTSVVPNFRNKVLSSSFGLSPPRWVVDPDFDLSWHLRRAIVPSPGGIGAVLDLARTAGMTAFDKDRPLWEFTVLEGLPDGRAALVMKVHHALTDGVGGMQIANEIVDFSRSGTDRGPDPQAVPAEGGGQRSPSRTGLWSLHTGMRLLSRASSAPVGMSRALTTPIATARRVAAVTGSVARFTRPVTKTLSPIMVERSTRRQFAVVDVPLDDLRRAAGACHCTMNDAFLAAVLLGLKRYHAVHGAEACELSVTLPMSLRVDSDPLGGNRITLARFTLPLVESDPGELVRVVGRTVATWRDEPAVGHSSSIAAVLNLLPASILGTMLKHVDFVASDVPGPTVPLYLAGAKICEYYAFSPTLGAAFNTTLLSYSGRCFIGINVDCAAVPDVSILVRSLAGGLRTVGELGTSDSPSASR
ncbi:wax ester/triacylglycerol synthase domain-containing protein [Rhodococcus sp. NPDC059234]|uniref:wax ester/triacylglycerol synthase domain-containing protein n=1 Tax=Rhodococcus sp. NPDC059234 TaxID=3346781 RepID=UPI003672C211